MITQLVHRLRKLQKAFIPFRKKYSDVIKRVDECREKLVMLQEHKVMHPQENRFLMEEQEVRADFLKWSRAATSYMAQKTKVDWLQKGDANTKFFHSVLKKNHDHKRVYSITTETGQVITDYNKVIHHFREYYVQMLGTATSKEDRFNSTSLMKSMC